MNDKINLTKMDGAIVSADNICYIENVNTNKRYLYFTLNEISGVEPNSTVKIYVSKIKQDNPTMDTPISDQDWDLLKGIMGDSLKGVANPNIKYLAPSELGSSPVSVSERAIAMPTSYDYINKQRGIYAQNVAISSPAPQDAVTQAPVEAPASEPAPVQEPVAPTPTEVPTPELTIIPENPAPVSQPIVETPAQPAPVVETAPQEPVPTEPVTPLTSETTPIIEQAVEQVPTTPVEESAPIVEDTKPIESSSAVKLEPIDITAIEAKYDTMFEELTNLKNRELEAARRYNATLELNALHNEQHANFVEKELKESITNAPTEQPIQPVPTPAEVPPVTNAAEQAPVPEPTVANSPISPTPVTPVVPEPAPAVSEQDLETNWFDMPANN